GRRVRRARGTVRIRPPCAGRPRSGTFGHVRTQAGRGDRRSVGDWMSRPAYRVPPPPDPPGPAAAASRSVGPGATDRVGTGSGGGRRHLPQVLGDGRVDRDARTHGGRDRDLPEVAALRGGR